MISDLTKKMHIFVHSKGWYESDSFRPQTPKNLAISISIEASEILEYFQWGETIQDKKSFSNELADVALYLFQLASITGIDLEQAIEAKLVENQNRSWDDSQNID